MAREYDDDEGTRLVDRRTRQHILDLRERIDEAEWELFAEARTNPDINLARDESTLYYGMAVRQYLRGIKRLWSEDVDQVQNANHYWEEYELGAMQLVPPDTEHYDFSLIAQYDDDQQCRRALGLPRGAELPQPHPVPFNGLASVLYNEVVSHNWSVTIDRKERKTVPIQTTRPVAKPILDETVEVADEFLQQSGLGFELEELKSDAGFDYSDILENGPPGGTVATDGGAADE